MISTNTKQDKSFADLLMKNIGLEAIDATFVLQWVADNFYPADVFPVEDLEDWAKNHGYTLND